MFCSISRKCLAATTSRVGLAGKVLSPSRSWISSSSILRRYIDYYATLGVNRDADSQAIKLAYFRQAKKYHPDQNPSPDAVHMFELLSEAYEVLSDPVKRKNFNEYGTAGDSFGGVSRGPVRSGRVGSEQRFTADDLYSKIFGEMENAGYNVEFGAEPEHEANQWGHDGASSMVVNLSFEDAARGCFYMVAVNYRMICKILFCKIFSFV